MKMGVLGKAGLFIFGIVVGALLYATAPALLQTSASEPPLNFIAASDRLHTSGQPTAAQLSGLQAAGYDLVINLAPPQTIGSIPDEGKLVAQTGLPYVNIPVDWENPTLDDFEIFSAILKNSKANRVLVHCQLNQRASVFTFLYRVEQEGIEPEKAYDSVRQLWVPDSRWVEFSRSVLKRKKIGFVPY